MLFASRSRSFLLVSALSVGLGLALSACSAPRDTVGTSTSPITSGAVDDADGPVVWIVASVGGRTGYCSGVVVSPHVVLTAGHCTNVEAKFSIFLGSDYTDASAKALAENYVAVAEHLPHPQYNPNTNTHDLGVLVTEAPIPRKAVTINRDPLTASDVGAPIRIVGFGQTSGTDKTIGRRHEAMTTISEYDGVGLAMSGTPSFCLFDSGGPTFMTRGGAEVVAGVHSIVESTSCDATAWDTRVDVHAAFIDEVVAKADPPAEDAGVDAGPTAAEPPAAGTPVDKGCSLGASRDASGAGLTLALMLAVAASVILRRRIT